MSIINISDVCDLLQEVLNLTETHGVFVRVRAGIDVIAGDAIWEFQTIDPATGNETISCCLHSCSL